jgi:hypothetical protein
MSSSASFGTIQSSQITQTSISTQSKSLASDCSTLITKKSKLEKEERLWQHAERQLMEQEAQGGNATAKTEATDTTTTRIEQQPPPPQVQQFG